MSRKMALLYVAVGAVVVGFANFFWFMAESASLGGDALNGYVANGRYFVGSHGAYREVSQAAWEWSRIHGLSVLLTHPLALLGMGVLVVRIAPLFMGGEQDGDLRTQRASAVLGSGPALASGRCGGVIGGVSFSAPFLRVSVHPGGVLISPAFMAVRTILRSEIAGLRSTRRFFSRTLEIQMASPDPSGPVWLFVTEHSRLGTAIASLTTGAGRTATERSATERSAMERSADALQSLGPPILLLRLSFLVFSVALIVVGIVWFISQLGAFGFLWTVAAIVISVANVRSLLRSRATTRPSWNDADGVISSREDRR